MNSGGVTIFRPGQSDRPQPLIYNLPEMTTIQGPAKYMAGLGYKGIQVPTWDSRLIDLEKAATSKTYAEEWKGRIAEHGLTVTELASHLQGQLVAVHPAYTKMYEGFAPREVAGNPKATQEWAVQQMKWNAKASQNLGLTAHPSFPGALLWPYLYPWPQRPAGLVEEAFGELARMRRRLRLRTSPR